LRERLPTKSTGCPQIQDFSRFNGQSPQQRRRSVTASEILFRRYYRGKPKERLAEAHATMSALALGDRIRILRERAGLTQAELAKRTGTQPSQISRIEDADYNGHSMETLRRIATALHATLRIELVPEAGKPRRLLKAG
jgi:ribosome-binding protein aMBF1 (putative translation factor)